MTPAQTFNEDQRTRWNGTDGEYWTSNQDRLDRTLKDVAGAVGLVWESPSVMARFEEAGPVSREVAEMLGLVGVAARASGLERDARFDFPSGIFQWAQIPVSTWQSGDVFAYRTLHRGPFRPATGICPT